MQVGLVLDTPILLKWEVPPFDIHHTSLISSPPFGRRSVADEFGGENPWETESRRRWTIESAGVPGLECAEMSALWLTAERALKSDETARAARALECGGWKPLWIRP